MSVFADAIPGMLLGETRSVTAGGHTFAITALAQFGCDSGRRRYRVECTTCELEVHEATTGPMQNVSYHLREVAKESTRSNQ